MNDVPEVPQHDPETLEDVSKFFEDLGEGPPSTGRPDDYPGVEILTILHVLRGFTAGKQFAPDPDGEHRAVKVRDYNIGMEFIPTYAVVEGLADVHDLLSTLASDNGAFLVRGTVGEWAGRRRRRRAPRDCLVAWSHSWAGPSVEMGPC